MAFARKKMDVLSQCQKNKLLKDVSTFGIGGPAEYFIEVKHVAEMQAVLAFCYNQTLPFFILGKGSNCLFDDRGFRGLVIHNKISFCKIEGMQVEAGAGYSFSLLGVQTARKGLAGLEFASGIPASVGGAVFMNAGANGQDTAECLQEVSFVDEQGRLEVMNKDQLEYSYRFSSFQKRKGAIVAAKFLLHPSQEARHKQLSIIDYRTRTQPYSEKSAGCVFRNPGIGASAGALIEKSGLKGLSQGGAQVSEMHANFIINQKEASAHDVLQLAEKVKWAVKEHSGIELEMEIRCIPYQTE
jgi:UDP-N-acetylmuramate dehydrogenase